MQPLVYHPITSISQGQVNDAQNSYNQDSANTIAQQGQLNDFQKNMQSGTDMYAQQQKVGNQWAGYDPAKLQSALQNVQQTQNTIAGLPQSINAQNSNYGATSSQLAGQYSGMMNNLNPALAAQTNAVTVDQATQQAAGAYAQNATTAGITTQQQKLDTMKATYAGAQQTQATAQQQLSDLNKLFEQQGQFNSDEARQYMDLNRSIAQTQATMNNLNAQAGMFAAQTRGFNIANNSNQALFDQQQATRSAAPSTRQDASASWLQHQGTNPTEISNYQSHANNPWGMNTISSLLGF